MVYKFFDKKHLLCVHVEASATLKINWLVVVLKVKTSQTKNYTNQLLEKLKKTKNTPAFYKQYVGFCSC